MTVFIFLSGFNWLYSHYTLDRGSASHWIHTTATAAKCIFQPCFPLSQRELVDVHFSYAGLCLIIAYSATECTYLELFVPHKLEVAEFTSGWLLSTPALWDSYPFLQQKEKVFNNHSTWWPFSCTFNKMDTASCFYTPYHEQKNSNGVF